MLLLGECGNIVGEERFILTNTSLPLLNLLFHLFTEHNLGSLRILNIRVHLGDVLVFLFHLVEDLLLSSINSLLQRNFLSSLLCQILLQKCNSLVEFLISLMECRDFLI